MKFLKCCSLFALLFMVCLLSPKAAHSTFQLGFSQMVQEKIDDLVTNKGKGEEKQDEAAKKETQKAEDGGPDAPSEAKELNNKQKIMKWAKKTAKAQAKKAAEGGIDAIKSGNFDPSDVLKGMADGAMDTSQLDLSEMTNLAKDYVNKKKQKMKEKSQKEQELKDLEKMEKEERRAKVQAIDEEILEKETAFQALSSGSDEALKLGLEIKDLKDQREALVKRMEEDNAENTDSTLGDKADSKEKKENKLDAIGKKYAALKTAAMDSIDAANEEIDAYSTAIDDLNTAENMQKMVDSINIFGDNAETDTQTLYKQIIQDFFLEEDEQSTAESRSRIMQNRQRAYYDAVQNLFLTGTQTLGKSWQTEDDAKESREMMSETAETNFGAKGMQRKIDTQIVRSAAQLTKLLLAHMRLETAAEIQRWNFEYMNDYDQDVTVFNLDDYIFDSSLFGKLKNKAKDLFKSGKKKGIGAARGVANNLQNGQAK